MLVDGSGRLRFWAAVASFQSHGNLTPSTVAMRLSAIERLYVYAETLWPRDSALQVAYPHGHPPWPGPGLPHLRRVPRPLLG